MMTAKPVKKEEDKGLHQLMIMNSIFAISKSIFIFSNYNSVGHKGKFGHEFLEFEFKPNGRLRYANNS